MDTENKEIEDVIDKDNEHFTSRYIDRYNSKGKFTTTKGQLYLTVIIFIAVLGFVAYMYLSGKIKDAYDVAALVSMISVSGAIAGSNLCWYTKKSAAQRQYELRMALYHDSARVRLNYNEAMIKMMKKYHITQADIDIINENGEIDEMMDSAIHDTINNLDTNTADADSPNTLDTFNL